MIELLPSPDHLSAFRIAGHLTAVEYDRLIADVEARLERHARIAVYCDATGFRDIAPDALAKDFAYALGHIGEWNRYARMALVTDKAWLRMLTKTFGPLVPGLEARVFEPGQQAEALAWVSADLT